MTPSAILYAAADYMREHGFSPEFGKDGCPRCFSGSMSLGCSPLATGTSETWDSAFMVLNSIVGDMGARALRRDGWNTDDAVAALTIAADIAFEDERARGTT